MDAKVRKAVLAAAALLISLIIQAQGLAQGQKKGRTALEERTGHGAAPGQARFSIPEGVRLDDGLSEDEAVAIALWNNGALHADLAALGLARADLMEAGLLRNPIAQLVLPIGPFTQFEGLFNLPFEAFWQRKRRVAFAEAEVGRVAQSLEQTALNLERDVRVAWSDLLLAGERVRLASESIDLRREIARLTDVRLRAGDVSEIESTAARLDFSLALEQANRQRRDEAIARDRLAALMGMESTAPDFKLQPATASQAVKVAYQEPGPAAPPVESLLKTAYQSRPDLRAAEFGIESAARRAKWEHSRIMALSGLLNVKQGEGLGFSPRPGVLLDLPVFNRNQGGVMRADAEVERAAWSYLAVRQRIGLEVREAFNQLAQARESLELWHRQVVPQAEENVRLSGIAYDKGEQSYLFVLDASRRLVEVRLREVEFEADIRRANAQLERSLGRKPDAKP